MMKKYAEY